MGLVAVLALVALPADKKHLAPWCIAAACFLPWEHMRLARLSVDHGSGAFRSHNTHLVVSATMLPTLLVCVAMGGQGIVGRGIVGWGSLPLVVALTVVSPMLGLALRLAMSRDRNLFRAVSPTSSTLIKEGYPFLGAVMASDLFSRFDMFLVLWLASLTDQGYFAAAVAAANLLVVAPNALALFTFNAGAKLERQVTLRGVFTAATALVTLQLVTALAFAAVLPTLIAIVFGSSFSAAIPFALALLPAYAVKGCACVAEGYLRGRNRASVGIWSRILGATVIIAVVAMFFGTWQVMCIPWAVLAGQVTSAAWIFSSVIRDVQVKTGGRRPETED